VPTAPYSNRAFNLRLRAACRTLGVGEITGHGLRRSAATILLNQVGKEYPHDRALYPVGYEQTRQTLRIGAAFGVILICSVAVLLFWPV
jgi:integrase